MACSVYKNKNKYKDYYLFSNRLSNSISNESRNLVSSYNDTFSKNKKLYNFESKSIFEAPKHNNPNQFEVDSIKKKYK